MSGKAGPEMARMDTQMKAMREMHDKMIAAKTPEERNALTAEHMQAVVHASPVPVTGRQVCRHRGWGRWHCAAACVGLDGA